LSATPPSTTVDVRPILAVLEIRHLAIALDRARRRPGVAGLGHVVHPERILIAAGAAVVVPRRRGQHDGHRRGGGRGARQANLVEIRAEKIEVVLEEREPRPRRDVGPGRDRDRDAGLVEEIAERRTLEQDLVVELGGELRAPGAAADELVPVERVQGA
jgi:hypothetical protein